MGKLASVHYQKNDCSHFSTTLESGQSTSNPRTNHSTGHFLAWLAKREISLQVEQLLKLVKKLQEVGELEPKIEDLIAKIKKLQEAKRLMNEELCNLQSHGEALQEELDKLNTEKTYLEEALHKKQEALGLLQLQCDEKEAETQRKQQIYQDCKQKIEDLISSLQEEKLKQRKQRMEFEKQLEELIEKHKSLWEFHTAKRLVAEISNMGSRTELLLKEEREIQEKLDNVLKQLDTLSPHTGQFSEEGVFLRSKEAAAALNLFEEENRIAKSFMEVASVRYLDIQQKCTRLKSELCSLTVKASSTSLDRLEGVSAVQKFMDQPLSDIRDQNMTLQANICVVPVQHSVLK
ncbi:synaptonemal complex central element protein 1-like [Microcaecilia unicolor]|uniref:Synaptonemal complex central element protein 1-like n=1 Tax=Microcaecilia unicolor TaxID=1415580 RepID=A0A6P7XBG6_9AMPH|nr:synaptonemal complex central element protein 1-like [Microcaecilia unicolor]